MKKTFCGVLVGAAILSVLGGVLEADEWKARHDLLSHTGLMNLTEPAPPDEVFFSGPTNPADAAGWLEGLKAWRKDRITLLRYKGSQYERQKLHGRSASFLRCKCSYGIGVFSIWTRANTHPSVSFQKPRAVSGRSTRC